ncbi:Uncharacterized protein RNJ44_02269 [Nakaseomyces bracarensis]|uniref:MHD domain-containing protein n=1 Tax=Nakaseomyces bracarensis TaxID=273131 RepID=A0ABR4NN11_9SACH
MSSCIAIFDETLEPLVSKNVKGLPNVAGLLELFCNHVRNAESPIVSVSHWRFVYMQRDSLYFVAVVDSVDDNLANYMSIMTYLDQFYRLILEYAGLKTLDRTLILDNTLLVMELIDETLDYGIVQITEPSIMKDYIRVKVNLPDERLLLEDIWDQDSDSDSDDDKKHRKHKHKNKSKSKSNHHNQKSQEKGKDDIISKVPKSKQELDKVLKTSKDKVYKKIKENMNELEKLGKFRQEDEFNDDDANANETFINSYIAKTTTMAVSWRAKGLHYSKNEFFLDVIEKVQYLVDFKLGVVRRNLIHGQIVCRSYLSGMPNLKISLNKLLQNDQQFINQIQFHQCVSLESLEKVLKYAEEHPDESSKSRSVEHSAEKEIEFIPPDGDFVLCTYDLKRHIKDPPMIILREFEVKPKWKKFKLKITATIETHFKPTNTTTRLDIKIPLAKIFEDYKIDLSKNLRFKTNNGHVSYNISDDFLLWEVGVLKGGKVHAKAEDIAKFENIATMITEFALFNEEEYEQLKKERETSMNPPPLREGPKLEEIYKETHDENLEGYNTIGKKSKQPLNLLTMNFEVPYCTASGLKVEYLKIEEDQLQYQSFPWVRYKTINDDEYAYIV